MKLSACAAALLWISAAAGVAGAADGLPGATVRPGDGAPAAVPSQREEWCKANHR